MGGTASGIALFIVLLIGGASIARSGTIDVELFHVPGEDTVAVVAAYGETIERDVKAEASTEALSRQDTLADISVKRCGYSSRAYASNVLTRNGVVVPDDFAIEFLSKKLDGYMPGVGSMTLPACLYYPLNSPNRYTIKKGDGTWNVAPAAGIKELPAEKQRVFGRLIAASNGLMFKPNAEPSYQEGMVLTIPWYRSQVRVEDAKAKGVVDKLKQSFQKQAANEKIDAGIREAILKLTTLQVVETATSYFLNNDLEKKRQEKVGGLIVASRGCADDRLDWDSLASLKEAAKFAQIEAGKKLVGIAALDTGLAGYAASPVFTEYLAPVPEPYKNCRSDDLTCFRPGANASFRGDFGPHICEPYPQHGTAVSTLLLGGVSRAGYISAASYLPMRLHHYRVARNCAKAGDALSPALAPDFDYAMRWVDRQNADQNVEDAKIRIVNVSYDFGSEDVYNSIATALKRMSGVLVIAAAGNDGQNPDEEGSVALAVPAGMSRGGASNVLAVGALDGASGKVAASSAKGSQIDLFAPGVCIPAWSDISSVTGLSGTSMSAAFVSHVAGLMFYQRPGRKPHEIKRRLLATADFSELDELNYGPSKEGVPTANLQFEVNFPSPTRKVHGQRALDSRVAHILPRRSDATLPASWIRGKATLLAEPNAKGFPGLCRTGTDKEKRMKLQEIVSFYRLRDKIWVFEDLQPDKQPEWYFNRHFPCAASRDVYVELRDIDTDAVIGKFPLEDIDRFIAREP